MDKIFTTTKCRLCDSAEIFEILNFGNIPLANNLREAAELDQEEFTAPLRVFQCKNCGSNQLFDEVSPDILFKNYNYASPPNLTKHFKEYAQTVVEKLFGDVWGEYSEKKSLVVGIGGNNGLLEREFQIRGFKNVINIEPAGNIAEISRDNGVPTINQFFTKNLATFISSPEHENHGKAKIITCNNCFAHIPDLNEIVEGIKVLLDEEGIFVFENAYWLNTILNLDFGQVYHEHYFYHSIKPLKKFFEKHGLELFDVELNSVQLGSFRCYVSWPGRQEISSSVKNLIKLEEDFGLYRVDTFESFKQKIVDGFRENWIKLCNFSDQKIALYGVPAKIVLFINFFELEKFISYAVDDSEIKQNKFVPGTRIPIKNSQFWKENNPAATLIGAYNFANDIKKKNPDYSGDWITPFKK